MSCRGEDAAAAQTGFYSTVGARQAEIRGTAMDIPKPILSGG